MVAPQNSKGEDGVEPHQKSSDHHKKSREPRRYEICHVIQARGELAKVEVTFGAIADHGVQCVDGFVGYCQWNPAQKKIEERGDNAIVGTFSQRFQAGAKNFVLVQRRRFAADDMRKFFSGLSEIACTQRCFNTGYSVEKSARGKSRGG